MDKAELIRHEIEKRRDHNLAIGNPLFAAMAKEDIELLSFIDSLQGESTVPVVKTADGSLWNGNMMDAAESLGISQEEYNKIVNECIYGKEEPVSEELERAARNHLWKDAQGDDLPEIDREVIALTQPYPNDEHLKVVFAHRPTKYTKVWNSDLGEEQVVEIERYGKGEWNIPDIKYWLDVELPKEIEL